MRRTRDQFRIARSLILTAALCGVAATAVHAQQPLALGQVDTSPTQSLRPYNYYTVQQAIFESTGQPPSNELTLRVLTELDRRYEAHLRAASRRAARPNVYDTPPVPGTFAYRLATFQSSRPHQLPPPIWNGREWIQPRATPPLRIRQMQAQRQQTQQGGGGGGVDAGEVFNVIGTILGILLVL